MTKKQALNYLKSSGFSKEQIKAVVDALQEPTTKNLGVDAISRAEAQTQIEMNASRYTLAKERRGMGQVEWSDQLIKVSDAVNIIRNLPSVTPISKECIDCIAEDKTFDKMDRVKQLLNNDKLDDWEVLKKIGEVVEE